MIKYLVVLMLLITSVHTYGDDLKELSQTYKCHITYAKGDKVLFYRWKQKDANTRIATLPGKQNIDTDGKKFFIKDVVECVPLSQNFTSEASQLLDKRTLR